MWLTPSKEQDSDGPDDDLRRHRRRVEDVDARDVEAGAAVDAEIALVVVREDRVGAVAPEEGVDPRPADQRVVLAAACEDVVAGAAVEGVVRLLAAKLVVAGAAVDRVGLRAAAQQRLVAFAAGADDRPEEVEPGSRLAAAVEVVVAAQEMHLELERAGRERDVEVAVAARGEAVLAGGEVIGPLGAVDDDAVGGVSERGGDLDLRAGSTRKLRRGRRSRRDGRGSASRSSRPRR